MRQYFLLGGAKNATEQYNHVEGNELTVKIGGSNNSITINGSRFLITETGDRTASLNNKVTIGGPDGYVAYLDIAQNDGQFTELAIEMNGKGTLWIDDLSKFTRAVDGPTSLLLVSNSASLHIKKSADDNIFEF